MTVYPSVALVPTVRVWAVFDVVGSVPAEAFAPLPVAQRPVAAERVPNVVELADIEKVIVGSTVAETVTWSLEIIGIAMVPVSPNVPANAMVAVPAVLFCIWFTPLAPLLAFVPIFILTHLPAVRVADAPPEVMVITWLATATLHCELVGPEATKVCSVYEALLHVPLSPVAKSTSVKTIALTVEFTKPAKVRVNV